MWFRNDEGYIGSLQPVMRDPARVFLARCRLAGFNIRISQALRTFAEQQAIYNQGRTKPGKIVSWAKPGSSMHNYGLAFDICFIGKDPYISVMEKSDPKKYELTWQRIGEIGEACGLDWGGRWKKRDLPHFQRSGIDKAKLVAEYPQGYTIAA